MQLTAGAAYPDISISQLNLSTAVIMVHSECQISGIDANWIPKSRLLLTSPGMMTKGF